MWCFVVCLFQASFIFLLSSILFGPRGVSHLPGKGVWWFRFWSQVRTPLRPRCIILYHPPPIFASCWRGWSMWGFNGSFFIIPLSSVGSVGFVAGGPPLIILFAYQMTFFMPFLIDARCSESLMTSRGCLIWFGMLVFFVRPMSLVSGVLCSFSSGTSLRIDFCKLELVPLFLPPFCLKKGFPKPVSCLPCYSLSWLMI